MMCTDSGIAWSLARHILSSIEDHWLAADRMMETR
jgi:hypothetical protein